MLVDRDIRTPISNSVEIKFAELTLRSQQSGSNLSLADDLIKFLILGSQGFGGNETQERRSHSCLPALLFGDSQCVRCSLD